MTAPDPVADPRAALRTRFVAMREEIVETMVRDGFSAGLGALLAQLAASLDALDKAQGSPQTRLSAAGEPTAEASVSANRAAILLPTIGAGDGDPRAIRLVVYEAAEALAAVSLDPVRALALARELLADDP